MNASPAPHRGEGLLLGRIRECNAAAIARTGDIDVGAVSLLLTEALGRAESRQAAILELATFISSQLDDGRTP